MKCTFCNRTETEMPTVLEFLGLGGIGSDRETGICTECQALPREELYRRAKEVTQTMLSNAAIEIAKKKSRHSN